MCDTYLYNMDITNTLSSTDDIDDMTTGMEFPEADNIVCMWPLENDVNCKYQNSSIFSGISNPKFTSVVNDIRSPKTIFGTDENISCAILNPTNFVDGNQPDHLIFDTTFDDEKPKTISNAVRNILYEDSEIENVTLMFWGKLSDYNTHSPILIDALPEDRTQGLYFYLDQMLKADPSQPDKAPYKSGHQDYFNDVSHNISESYVNRWALYVMEFQHGLVSNDITRAPYNKKLFKDIKTPNTMRINMNVFWNKNYTNPTGVQPTAGEMLYPNKNTYDSVSDSTEEKTLIDAGFQFSMEDSYAETNILRFFANQVKGSSDKDTTNAITNFNFFSGCIRNMLMFNKILTLTEIYAIFSQGPNTIAYDWYDTGEYDIIKMLGKNNYFGTVYAHNVKQLNMINNKLAQTMK